MRVKHRSEVVQCRVRHVLLSNDIIQIIGCNFTEFQSTKCSWRKAGNGDLGDILYKPKYNKEKKRMLG